MQVIRMNLIDYGRIMISSMQQVVIEVLSQVEQHGLPGENHFVIEFSTSHEDVELPPRLTESYPVSMTIVLQHQFEDLRTDRNGFAVTLSFDDRPECIYIPVASIRSFTDPSAKFNLTFPDLTEIEAQSDPADRPEGDAKFDDAEAQEGSGEDAATVVSLEKFRNRPK